MCSNQHTLRGCIRVRPSEQPLRPQKVLKKLLDKLASYSTIDDTNLILKKASYYTKILFKFYLIKDLIL